MAQADPTQSQTESIRDARERVARAKLALLEVPESQTDLKALTHSIEQHPYRATLIGLVAGLVLSRFSVSRTALRLATRTATRSLTKAMVRKMLN